MKTTMSITVRCRQKETELEMTFKTVKQSAFAIRQIIPVLSANGAECISKQGNLPLGFELLKGGNNE